jgi:hypothetical protein
VSNLRIARTTTSWWEQFTWQQDFLRASIERYDKGNEHEAIRIAASLRVLCHDNPQAKSHSLIHQLNLDRDPVWLDSVHDRDALMPWGPLVVELLDGSGPRYRAPLQRPGHIGTWTTFDEWWSGTIFTDAAQTDFTRQHVVTCVANQDGGAHVDPTLADQYHRLTRQLSLGLPGATNLLTKVVRTPAWEALRQVVASLPFSGEGSL